MNTTPTISDEERDFWLAVEARAAAEVATLAFGTKELVAQFNRLTGAQLGVDRRAPIEKMVDSACGYHGEREEDIKAFAKFAHHCIWLSGPQEMRTAFRLKAFAETIDEAGGKLPEFTERDSDAANRMGSLLEFANREVA